MTVGSLFAGIGGFDLGFERAGFEIVWQVEIDDYCRRVLERHFPRAERFGDIRECGAHNLKPVDVICGGFPCQPFSSASRGRKSGTADTRYLWPAMRRIIAECKPTWVCAENVTQLDGPALEQVVAEMEALGHEVAPPLEIPACAFGHDHWRPRIWILAHANGNSEPISSLHGEVAQLQRSHCERFGVGTSNGIPERVALRMFGNAIVPQIAQWIAERIKEVSQKEKKNV